jgi:hypothetical protein
VPSPAFETAIARAGLRETPGPAEATATVTGVGRVLLHESPEGALTWHPPGSAPAPGAAPGRVRTFTFDLVDRVVEAFERRHRPHRLRTFGPDGTSGEPVDLDALAGVRVLMLVHGTAGTAASTFAALPDPALTELVGRYDGHVVAFEHPTVSVSPAANVAWLAEQLRGLGTRRLRVDLLAHSRGGLVSRLLAEQPDRTGRHLEVGRAVLVATPNAGTALASDRRLGQLLDRLTTLSDRLPENLATDVLEVLLTLVRQVAVGALDGLDGLAAMDPDGRFLTEELNVASGRPGSYAAVAADYEPRPGSALARVALDGLSDLVFDETANDLVVPTAGGYDVPGQAGFPIADRLVFDPSDAVDHNGYWGRPAFIDHLLRWLDGGNVNETGNGTGDEAGGGTGGRGPGNAPAPPPVAP